MLLSLRPRLLERVVRERGTESCVSACAGQLSLESSALSVLLAFLVYIQSWFSCCLALYKKVRIFCFMISVSSFLERKKKKKKKKSFWSFVRVRLFFFPVSMMVITLERKHIWCVFTLMCSIRPALRRGKKSINDDLSSEGQAFPSPTQINEPMTRAEDTPAYGSHYLESGSLEVHSFHNMVLANNSIW